MYKYISFTNDYSILDELCAYYEIVDEEKGIINKSECSGSVLEHLLKICSYLISNIDDRTDCLKILFGDWNDAICGLGSTDGDSKFGTGVSVMATLQLYKALGEMREILSHIGGYETEYCQLSACREKVANGLEKFAVEKTDNNKHILHGWGDKGSFKFGSVRDKDGCCRYSANSYSFWCISGMIERDISFKESILKAYEKLDSKYGIRTIYPPVTGEMREVGRIVNITPGTYENCCTYVHATMFAAMALFCIGEYKKGWEQLEKAMVITHNEITKTSFVMPNSYCYNEEYCIDGESTGDWYTGSGAVLMRNIVEYAFGVQAELDGVKIYIPNYMPCEKMNLLLKIKGTELKLIYNDKKQGFTNCVINGNKTEILKNKILGTEYIFIDNSSFNNNLEVEMFY